jgi:hypothetical protein
MSQISYTPIVDGDQPLSAGFNSRWLLAINLINSGLESDNLANSAVTTAKISSGAVTLHKLESGTQGDILYYAASGVPTRLSAGTNGQFLKTLGAAANPQWSSVPSAVGGQWRNLAVTRPGTTQVTVTADELVLYNTSLDGVRITAVNVTATITTSGANGLDTGAEAANTIYYVWVIRKSSDGTVAALLSVSTTIGAITFPSGYDQAALVSAVGNNNSSDFIDFKQNGRVYNFLASATLASGNVGISPWVSVDLTPANMSTIPGFVPSALSDLAFGTIYNLSGTVIATNDSTVAAGTTAARNKLYGSDSSTSWRFRILTADTIYWGGNTSDSHIYLDGFEINKIC